MDVVINHGESRSDTLVLLLYSCRIISGKGWGWGVGGGVGGGGGGGGLGGGCGGWGWGVGGGGGGLRGVGVERWAVRGREGGVHKGAPSNTATLGELLPYPKMGVWGGARLLTMFMGY